MENKSDRDELIYKTGNDKRDKTYDFQKFKVIKSSEREIYDNDSSLDDAIEEQIRFKDDIHIFKESAKPKESVKKEKNALTRKNAIVLLNERQKFPNAFESGIFSKEKQGKRLTTQPIFQHWINFVTTL